MISEIWKSVKNYEGLYEVSNFGRVKSLKRKWQPRERILRPCKIGYGYFQVNLWKKGKEKHFYTHRLVALAFIPNPENKPEVNHIDGDKANNNIPNLEWATSAENTRHARKTGLRKYSYTYKKVIQISKTGKVIKVWKSLKKAGESLGIGKENISSCCRGKSKSAGSFRWELF